MAPLSVSLYIFYSIAFLPSLSAHSEPSQNVPWNWYSSLNMSNVLYAQFVYFLMWIYFSGNWFVFQRSIFWSSPFLQLVPMLDWTCGGCPGSAVSLSGGRQENQVISKHQTFDLCVPAVTPGAVDVCSCSSNVFIYMLKRVGLKLQPCFTPRYCLK